MDNTSHSHSNPKLEADIKLAKHLYFDEYKSDDPNLQDHAEKELHHLHQTDPRALRIALKEIDAQEKAQREQNVQARAQQMQIANDQLVAAQAGAAKAQAQADAMQAALAADAAPAAPAPGGPPSWNNASAGDAAAAPPATVGELAAQPGAPPPPVDVANQYAPYNEFSQARPNSPAFDAAYKRDHPTIYGINTPILRLGWTSNGSFIAGANVGLVNCDAQVIGENRVSCQLLPYAHSPISARAHAGFGFDQHGVHGDAGGGAHALGILGVDGDGNGYVGDRVGADAAVRGQALFANGEGAGGAALDQNGIHAYTGASVDAAKAIGARGGADASLGPKTGFDAGVGVTANGHSLDVGPEAYVNPDGMATGGIHGDVSTTDRKSFEFTGDLAVDPRNERP